MKTQPFPPASCDIVRTHWPIEFEKAINLYLGNGRCGGCFDAWGLQHQPVTPAAGRVSNTSLAHAEVFHHGRYGIGHQVPLGRIAWADSPGVADRYRQTLSLATGRLTTRFENPRIAYTLEVWTDPDLRDNLFLAIEWECREATTPPGLTLRPDAVFDCCYNGNLAAEPAPFETPGTVGYRVRIGSAEGLVLASAHGDAAVRWDGAGLAVTLTAPKGRARLTLALGPQSRAEDLVAALAHDGSGADAAWARRWGNPPAVSLAHPDHESLFWRSVYHLLATYAPDVRCPAPPMGFTGNGWGYHFPQDLSYVHPALLRLGYTDIARAIVEFYHSRLDQQTRFTRRIYGKPGICWAWEFPLGEGDDLLLEGSPNAFQFEIHNAAYPARMAFETAQKLADTDWTRRVAWPVVLASARFLHACLAKGADGLWGLHVTPSMGQDEYGGENAPDYLCALFASEYTLKAALHLAGELGEEPPEAAAWRAILGDGFAYPRLLTEHGFYNTNGAVPFVAGQQKHPVQLDPLNFLPLGHVDEPTLMAWRRRHEVCSVKRPGVPHGGVPGSLYEGWSLFAFILAASHAGDTDGLAHELKQMVSSQIVDPDHITIYETSGFWNTYYTTSMGLFLQAMLDKDAPPQAWLDRAPRETGCR